MISLHFVRNHSFQEEPLLLLLLLLFFFFVGFFFGGGGGDNWGPQGNFNWPLFPAEHTPIVIQLPEISNRNVGKKYHYAPFIITHLFSSDVGFTNIVVRFMGQSGVETKYGLPTVRGQWVTDSKNVHALLSNLLLHVFLFATLFHYLLHLHIYLTR